MVEVVGDASRDGRWALVRLTVDGERIVSAEADGLERPLDGLTLLEAAAVGGEELAVDALANALGPRLQRGAAARPRRRRDERRCRQRRRAAARGAGRDRRDAAAVDRPAGPRLGARLLLAGGRDRRAPDLPRARTPARDARPARGVPPRGRRAVRARLRARARLRTRAFAATAASASPSCSRSPSAPAPSGLRPATTRGSSSVTGGCSWHAPSTSARTSRTCSPGSTRAFSTGSGSRSASRTKEETRAEAARAGLEAAARAESQEACFLAGDDYRDFLERHGLVAEEGRIVDEDGREARPPRRLLALHAGAAQGARRRGGRAALRAAQRGRDEHRRRRAARVARDARGSRPGSPVRAGRARGGEAPLPLAGGRRRGHGDGGGFRLQLDEPAYGVAPGQAAVLYDGEAVVGAGTIVPDPGETFRTGSAFVSEGE